MVKTGHSRGCGTCRRRKVGCDERRPICRRCDRARIYCEGYSKDFKWIDENSRSSRCSNPKTSSLLKAPNTDVDILIHRLDPVLSRGPSPFTDDAYINFTIKELFRETPFDSEYSYHAWIKQTLKSNADSFTYVAFQSAAAACFGRMHGPDQTILAQAARLYGKALVGLRDALAHPTSCYDHSNVSATMSLHLYEMICYTSKTGWMQHAGGAGRLIEIRGPTRHQEWPDHGYFTLMRPRIIIQALVSRKRTYLEKKEWMTIPWEKHPETKTPHQEVLDILVHIPGILEDYNAAKSIAQGEQDLMDLCKRFIPKLQKLLEQVFRWRWTWEERNKNAVWEAPPNISDTWSVNAVGKTIFPIILHFQSLVLAHEINIYNSIVILLLYFLSIMQGSQRDNQVVKTALDASLNDRGGKIPEKTNAIHLPYEEMTFIDSAEDIVHSVDFYTQEKNGNQGPLALLFPLRVCLLAYSLAGDQEMLRWIAGIQKKCAYKSAFEISRHLSRLTRLGTHAAIEGLDERVAPEVVEVLEHEASETSSLSARTRSMSRG